MGFISKSVSTLARTNPTFPGQRDGANLWRQIFGSTTKETPHKPLQRQDPVEGGTYGRSTVSARNSFVRLLEAFRSGAPGGWSDDRWEQTRHFTGIAYVAIHRIATQLQGAEFQVFMKDPTHPDGKRPVSESDLPQGDRMVRPYDLVTLLEKPNRQDSFGKMMYRVAQQKFLTGTAYLWMVPNQLGTPMELYCVPTALAIPQPAVNPDFPDGYFRIQPVYPYGPFSSYPTPSSAVGAPIPAQWMMKFQYPHPFLRYDGFSPLTGMRLHLDEIESMDRSRWYSMKRSINPSAVLNFDEMEGAQPLDEAEINRIHSEWENNFMGTENHGKLIVGTPGGRLDEFGRSPREMDWQSGWDQLTSFAMGGFGITRPAAGMVEDSSYSSLFATLKQLNLVTLDPECQDISSELTRSLAPFFGDNLIVEVRCRRIDDHDLKMSKLNQLMAARAITKNEMRKELEMPITMELWGNEIAGTESPMMPGMAPPGAPPAVPAHLLQAQSPSELAMMQGQSNQLGMLPGVGNPLAQAKINGAVALDASGLRGVEDVDEQVISRPWTGNIARGSVGPRKSLNGQGNITLLSKKLQARGKLRPLQKKSIYEQVRESLNGK
jgi:phage portal protein BeeE